MHKIRNICVVTGTRAEYGLLYWLMKLIKKNKNYNLQLVVTGAHLSKKHGNTYKQIINDGFKIDQKIKILNSDNPKGIAESTGLALKLFGKCYSKLKPDLLILLGDRYELMAAAYAALIINIPITHIHGGEVTRGAIDEATRHSITKMSHLHLTAAQKYRKRVIQLGEHPSRVHVVGGMGIESIKRLRLYSKTQLQKKLKIRLGKKNLIVTFHPVTLENKSYLDQINVLISALEHFEDIKLIFTQTNADTHGNKIGNIIEKYVERTSQKNLLIKSMGQKLFLSTLKHVDGIIGNSSSGLLEAPSFKIGTINIGDRQTGRIKAKSVIDCANNRVQIIKAINRLYSKRFQKSLVKTVNPYDKGIASSKCLKIIENTSFENIVKKDFYDM
tara:strand:- start:2397 stop:3557 length:1161 start_codon:yes stop_codon:yes gene_type:complete